MRAVSTRALAPARSHDGELPSAARLAGWAGERPRARSLSQRPPHASHDRPDALKSKPDRLATHRAIEGRAGRPAGGAARAKSSGGAARAEPRDARASLPSALPRPHPGLERSVRPTQGGAGEAGYAARHRGGGWERLRRAGAALYGGTAGLRAALFRPSENARPLRRVARCSQRLRCTAPHPHRHVYRASPRDPHSP